MPVPTHQHTAAKSRQRPDTDHQSAIFLLGNIATTRKELQTAPYRKELCVKRAEIALDFENKTDDELRAEFEFRTSWDQSGAMVRSALTILKENHWNVFHQ